MVTFIDTDTAAIYIVNIYANFGLVTYGLRIPGTRNASLPQFPLALTTKSFVIMLNTSYLKLKVTSNDPTVYK